VPQVPNKLPTVETAIIRPVCRPTCPRSETDSRRSAGNTPLRQKAGNPNRALAAMHGPHRGSCTHADTLNMMGWPTPARRNVHNPDATRNQARTFPAEYRSANHPPVAYPLLMAAKITPINAPHTNSELPKTGANSRLPRISNAITTAPVTKAVIRGHKADHRPEPEADCE
jgi:hypothetical protein